MPALTKHFTINLFGYRDRIINLDAEITHRALDLGMAEEQMDRAQIACAAINERPPQHYKTNPLGSSARTKHRRDPHSIYPIVEHPSSRSADPASSQS